MKWYDPSTPDVVADKPWLHDATIKYLMALLRPDMTVLEHGSGGSTVWLERECHVAVTSIESDPDWYAEIIRRKSGAKMILWDSRVNLPSLPDAPYDVMIIDGEPVEDRALYIRSALRLVKRGGLVILDNCNRPEYAQEREALQKKCDYYVTIMTHPGKYLNTEFYRLK